MSPKTFRKRTGKKLGKRQNGAGPSNTATETNPRESSPDGNTYAYYLNKFLGVGPPPPTPPTPTPPTPPPTPTPNSGGSKKRRQKKVRKTSKR